MQNSAPTADADTLTVSHPEAACFHCGLAVPAGTHWSIRYRDADHPACCPGCQAVAHTIIDSGYGDYYDTRDAPTGRPPDPKPLTPARIYDDPAIHGRFVSEISDSRESVSLMIEGIQCAACIWLIESRLKALAGVERADVNFATHRARVVYDPELTTTGALIDALRRVGYTANPYDAGRHEHALTRERRQRLRQLGIAGLFMMQLMTAAVALYFGEAWGIDDELRTLLRWVSLVLIIPVLAYSAAPIFANALRSIAGLRVGMDVAVSVGLVMLFAGSVHATVTGQGEVYYESAAMFVFFLLAARYVEFVARARSADAAERLLCEVPATVARIDAETGAEQAVAATTLAVGERIRVRPGETIAADGRIVTGSAAVSEALLTGESMPQRRGIGDSVLAGAIVTDSPIEIEITAAGSDTLLSHIGELAERAQTEKPRLVQIADRISGWFTLAVLIVAGGVAMYWWGAGDPHWLTITVSVLVVTCPCALSLAMPTALAAGNATLLKNGLVITRSSAIENLTRASVIVLDKTGTLTLGRPRLSSLDLIDSSDAEHCLRIAAALEHWSEHPVAHALRQAAGEIGEGTQAVNVTAHPGSGLSGKVNGVRYWIGNANWVCRAADCPAPVAPETSSAGTEVMLARAGQALCRFHLDDTLRPGAGDLVASLQAAGRRVMVLSGDSQHAVDAIGRQLGIDDARGELRPEDKLAVIRDLQSQGHGVAMVGDGINDAPVLAAADVSIAMGAGTDLARAQADLILLRNRMSALAWAFDTARQCLRIVRQNMVWAASYNTIALPAAMAGLITPWLAAIGMSASSLIVVLNAMRMLHVRPARGE